MNKQDAKTGPTVAHPTRAANGVTVSASGDSVPVVPDPSSVTSARAGGPGADERMRVRADDSVGSSPDRLPLIRGYELTREIAPGGMGVVFAARDVTLDREVAVKVMRAGMNAMEFVREARVTARLPHPGVPPVHALGTLSDGRPFLVMKLIKGRTLDALLRARTDPAHDRGRFVVVFEQICQTVGFAHAQGIVHRDLKPSNVMVGAFGEVQVMDWGLAKLFGASAEPEALGGSLNRGMPADMAATVAGQVKGTPAYMAPEQARGEPLDARADVFALGGVLAVMLTGRPPFVGESVLDTIIRSGRAELDEIRDRLDECGADSELVALANRCLAARPEERPSNGQEVAEAVAAYRARVDARLQQAERDRAAAEARASEEVNTRREAEARAAEHRKRRFVQLALAGAGLLVLALAGFGAGLAALWREAERARTDTESARDQLAEEKSRTEVARDEALRLKGFADAGRVEENRLRGLADQARDRADRARDDALAQTGVAERAQAREAEVRKEVEREREKLARFEYGRTMQVAHQEWRDNNVPAALALLESTRRDLRGWEYSYVHRLCHSDLLTLTGHTSSVDSASFSADGTRIVTASFDRTAKVWDAKTGKELLTLKGHTEGVNSASFSADGTRIVTASWDKTARVWEVPSGLAEGFAKNGKELITLKGHMDAVSSASFSADGTRIVTASFDRTAKVWNARTGAELLTLKGHTEGVNSASFSADGTRIVTASFDRTAKVWEVPSAKLEGFAKTGKELLTLKGHTEGVNSASFSADGTRIVTASFDRTAKVWEVPSAKSEGFAKNGAELLTLKGHADGVHSASFSADGSRIVTGSTDLTARVWDARTGAELLTLKGHTDGVHSASFRADGTRVVTGGGDKTARVWEVPSAKPEGFAKNGKDLLTFKGHTDVVGSASFSADGTRIVTASDDDTAKVWNARTGAELFTLKGHTGPVSSASFSPDGRRLVTVSADKTMKVWDARTGAELLTLKGHTEGVNSASFSADGSRIVTASGDQTVRVWEVPSAKPGGVAKNGKELIIFKGHTEGVDSATFSADGSRVVSASSDGTVRIWEVPSAKPEGFAKVGKELLKIQTGAHSASFSADGARVVTGGPDNTAKVWDARTGAELLTLKGHTEGVNSAAFSPEVTRIVTASSDRTVRVWDAKTGAEVLTLKGHTNFVRSASFSADGTRIVTGSQDQTAKVWDARPLRDTHPPDAERVLPAREVKRP